MEIVKAFQNNELDIHITVHGTCEEPLFRASDIGLILGFNDINNTVKNFTNKEKVRRSMPTLGGQQEVNFLTEIGLYKLLFKSRKEIAIQFQNWVCDVIKEIRLNGIYDLKKQLDIKDKENTEKLKKQMIIKDQEISTVKEKTMIDSFDDKPLVYIGTVEEDIILGVRVVKFGLSNGVGTRIATHKREIGPHFRLECVFETIYNRELEQLIKQKFKERIIKRTYLEKTQTELIQLDKTFTIKNLTKEIELLKDSFNDGEMIVKMMTENDQLKSDLQKSSEEIRSLKNENKSLRCTISGLTIRIPEKSMLDGQINNVQDQVQGQEPEKIQELVSVPISTPVPVPGRYKKPSEKRMESNRYIARNIETNEEREFDSYAAAHDISRIGPHSIINHYMNKPIHSRGWTFREKEKPYWQPPKNFIFNPEQKTSAGMIMCKSINIETKEVIFYNSVIEASEYMSKLNPVEFPDNDTNRRSLNRVISDQKPTTKIPLIYYKWSRIENCGSWVFPDGTIETIQE
jgi:prophage antirepressor-like protein